MNLKRKWLFFVLPLLVLSAALGWVKWRVDNPKPTELDMGVQKALLESKDAEVTSSSSSNAYPLTTKEQQEIASQLRLRTWGIEFDTVKGDYVIFAFTNGRIIINSRPGSDVYSGDNSKGAIIYNQLHPMTSRYLRQWLANHSGITKPTGIK